jgi:hypothetical protein
MKTDDLIDSLAQDLAPAPPLSAPWTRAAGWLLGTLVYLSALTLTIVSPAELAMNARSRPFVVYQVAAILIAVTAAGAAFTSTVPGDSGRSVRFAAWLALIWFGSFAFGALYETTREVVSFGAPAEWGCVAMIVLGGGLPGLVLVRMLRQGAPLTPTLSLGMGTLASVSLASVTACLAHPHPSDAVTFVWHGTTMLVVVFSVGLAGPTILPWATRRQRNSLPH